MQGIFTPPEVISPLGIGGAIGFTVLLIVGATILVVTSIASRDRVEIGAIVGAALGAIPLGMAEYRFFRAVDPANTLSTTLLWIVVLGVPVVAAIAISILLDAGTVGPGLLAAGGFLAGFLAGIMDVVQQRLAGVPVALATLLLLGILAVMYFYSSSRR